MELNLTNHAIDQGKYYVIEREHKLSANDLIKSVEARDVVGKALEDSVLQGVRSICRPQELRTR